MDDFLDLEFVDVEKYNPYHGKDGRFTTADGATLYTYRTKNALMQGAADKANEREKKRTAAEDEAKKPGNRKLNLNQDAIRRADDNSMMGSAGSSLAREAQSRVDAYKERNKAKDDWTDEQKEYAKQREDEYTKLVEDYYNDQISRRANNVSWVVAGPANFDHRGYEKRDSAMRNKADEYEEKLKRFEENTNKKLSSMTPDDAQIAYWRNGKWKHGETIDASDPLAAKKLQAKLDYLNESQANMKAANAYYKKNGTMEGFSGFSDATNKKIDAQMKLSAERGFSARKPFESYSLTNNNAQIKATQQRIKDIESQKARAASGGGSSTFNGGKLVRNTEANRLQLVFDEKPSAEMRAQLKANGFKWAPSQGAWQRQLTDNAERAAERILGESMQKMYRPAQTFDSIRAERIQKNAYDEWLEEHLDASEEEQKRMKKKLAKEKDSDSDEFQIMKSDDDKREVFGWALVAIRKDGEQIVDHQKDVVDPDELEHAAYEYVLNFRDTGELHDKGLRKKGKLIESVVLTKEKQAAMGIPEGTVPEGWWVGFKIEDDAAWQGIKSGRYRMFSIEGQGIRQPMDD